MLAEGTVLQGRYRIGKVLGEGSMGRVYQGRDLNLECDVAVKQAFFAEEHLRAAFSREAKLLRRLTHANLPKVTDLFTEGNVQYLVMDFIAGKDLHALLAESGGRIALAPALAWADQVLDALEYLHGQEPPVIHRDIKPGNLKLTEKGKLYVLDFGLAKGFHTQASRMPAPGSMYGYTPGYAPIEQMQRTGTDARSDIYAVGATLYHLLTGTPPADALVRAMNLLGGQADPLRPAHEVNPKIPAGVSAVLERATAISGGARPATAAEMRRELREAIAPRAPIPPTIVVPQLAPSFVNSIGMEFVLIPSGKFRMGSNEYDDEKPIHEVTIGSPFYLGKYQVMQGEWMAVMGENPSRFTGDDRLPVETVSWDDCQGFIRRLNARKDGYEYLLPSEAEWEYACRAGTRTPFSFGETITPEQVNYDGNLPYGNAPKGKYRGKTTRVGSFAPNVWGLHDMHGNVLEWCQDRWHENYNRVPTDGVLWKQGSDNLRVLRGGSWLSGAHGCRSADRYRSTPTNRYFYLGLRVVVRLTTN